MSPAKSRRRRKAKILIVDDHPTVREGLAMRIGVQPDLEVCAEAADVAEALRVIPEAKPDVAVVDISLKTGTGLDLIKSLKARHAPVRVLVWSIHGENHYAERALRAGAMGYITKEEATDQIIGAIRQVRDGRIYLSEALKDQLLKRSLNKPFPGRVNSLLEGLSDRELEVFQLIGNGHDTQQVAGKMHLSPKTVETYVSRIRKKLGLNTGRELIQKAVQWVAGAAVDTGNDNLTAT